MTERILEGKSVIVTGAARGLGRAMTLGLLGAGAAVTMMEIDDDALGVAAAEAEGVAGKDRVLAVAASVADEAAAATVVERTLETFGTLDALINNAAFGPQNIRKSNLDPPRKIWEIEPEMWRRTLEVNTTGAFIMASAALPAMLAAGSGRIVNVTTSLNTMYRASVGAYGLSKAAEEAFTAALAADLEGTGVTANVLVPGGPANTRMIPDDGHTADRTRLIQPEIMVAPAVWLVSDASAAHNGRRFIAARWDDALTPDQAADKAGAPAAWPQLGQQAIRPV